MMTSGAMPSVRHFSASMCVPITDLLRRWIRNVRLKAPTDRSELKASITQVKELAAREKNPVSVPLKQGWSPYHADKFLANEGLVTEDYHQVSFGNGLWSADSKDLKIGDDIFPGRISYRIEGGEFIARKLKLKIDFFATDIANTDDKARQRFLEVATQLFQEALNQKMPEEFRKNIMAEIPHSQTVEDKSVKFTREPWHPAPGYSLRFIIEK